MSQANKQQGCCKTCKLAIFERTQTGRIKRNVPGRCDYDLSQFKLVLPMCASHPSIHKMAIWPSYSGCPVWVPKDEE